MSFCKQEYKLCHWYLIHRSLVCEIKENKTIYLYETRIISAANLEVSRTDHVPCSLITLLRGLSTNFIFNIALFCWQNENFMKIKSALCCIKNCNFQLLNQQNHSILDLRHFPSQNVRATSPFKIYLITMDKYFPSNENKRFRLKTVSFVFLRC